MKKQYIYSALVLTALLSAGCAKEIENTLDGSDSAAIELSSVSTDPMTKAVVTGTSFTTDEAAAGIGLFLLDANGKAYGSNEANVKYTFSSSKWTASQPLRIGNTKGTLVGYYPYSEGTTNVKAIPVASSINGTDYLYGSIAEITSAKAKTESLTLSHALTRLRITFKRDNSFVGSGTLSSLTIEGNGIAASGTLNATTGEITATKAPFTVSNLNATINTAGLTEDCLVVPAAASATPQAVTLKFTVDGKAYKVDLKNDLAVKLQSGIQTDITLTVKNTSVSIDGSSIGLWGDGGTQTVTAGGNYTVTVKLSDAVEDEGIADDLIVQCKPEADAIKVEVCSKTAKPLVIRIGDDTRIAPVENGNVSTFTVSDITSDITATLAYAKTFTVTAGSIVPDVEPDDEDYFNNVKFEGLGDVLEGRTRTVKVGTVFGYHTKMACEGRTVTGDTIVLEGVSKDLEVSANYEFYDYPLPGVFTVTANGRKVRFARGNMWYPHWQELAWEYPEGQRPMGVFTNEYEQYIFSTDNWSEDGHISHFMWCRSPAESVKEQHKEGLISPNDNLFTNFGEDHLSPNPNLNVSGQKGLWRVLTGNIDGEWDYLLNSRVTKYGHRYAEVKVNDMSGLLIFPDEFTWPAEAGDEPATFDEGSADWNNKNYEGTAFEALQTAGCVFLPAAGYRCFNPGLDADDRSYISGAGDYGCYWSASAAGDDCALDLHFGSGSVVVSNVFQYDYISTPKSIRLVTEVN